MLLQKEMVSSLFLGLLGCLHRCGKQPHARAGKGAAAIALLGGFIGFNILLLGHRVLHG